MTFATIGSGWRAQMFWKVARELGTIRCGGVVVRTPRSLEVPTFTSLDACLREVRPDFVLVATPRAVAPGVIVDAVDRGVPVLAETPPAPDLDALRALWSSVGATGTGAGGRAVPDDALARRSGRPGGDRRDRLADPGAGLLDPAVSRRLADPRPARRRPRTGFGAGESLHRAAGRVR